MTRGTWGSDADDLYRSFFAFTRVFLVRPDSTGRLISIYISSSSQLSNFHHSAWSLPKELTPLKKHEITAYLQAPSKKKKGDLFAAYEIAEDPKEWLETRASGAGGEDEDMEVEDEDELAEEVDEEPEESAGKKRKRGGEKKASGAADNKAKKAKLEKLAKSKKVSLANRSHAAGFVRLSG